MIASVYNNRTVITRTRLVRPVDDFLERTESARKKQRVKMPSCRFSTYCVRDWIERNTKKDAFKNQTDNLEISVSLERTSLSVRLTNLSFVKGDVHLAGCQPRLVGVVQPKE